MRRSWSRRSAGAASLLAASLLVAACGLIAGVDGLDFVPECTGAAGCDDHDPCTVDTCDADAGACAHAKAPAGTPCGDGTLACDAAGHCAGTITCDDDAETDVDCGGPACPPCAQGKKCGVTGDCAAGLSCVDGVCCDAACAGPCVSCALPGQVGACAPLAAGEPDPTGGCTSPKACDGAGQCLTALGQSCQGDAECASGACADGVCCESECTGTCRACNLPGTSGTCAFAARGFPDDTCTNQNRTCDGVGGCKLALGQSCNNDGQCAYGACAGTCKLPLGDPCTLPSECASGACNVVCKLALGEPCVAAADCASNHCVDTVCCNGNCNGQCRACDVMGSQGTCTLVPAGTPDPACPGGSCAADGGCM